jgi:succinate-semialdehyde dehydrogenase/glutarate-semialdehyde dehydrogenase
LTLKQVDGAISHGAKVIMGGKRIDPTILTDIKPNNPAFREEFFGPVALFFRVKDEDHAIALANDSEFGLGGSGNRLASSDRAAALDACIVPKS